MDKDALRKIAIGFAAVTEVVVCSLSGFAGGYYLDAWLKTTSPWLTVLFSLLGLIAGFFRLYKVYLRNE